MISIACWRVSISLADLTTLIDPTVDTGSRTMTDVAAVALTAGTTPGDQVGNESVEPPVGSRARGTPCRSRRGVQAASRPSSSTVKASSAPNSAVAPSTPTRCPTQYHVLGIKRVDEEDVGLLRAPDVGRRRRPARPRPVKYQNVESCRYSYSTSWLRFARWPAARMIAPVVERTPPGVSAGMRSRLG